MSSNKITVGTLFTGGGVGLSRLDSSRYEIAWGVEYDPAIAEVYRANHKSSDMVVGRVQDQDPYRFSPVDLFQVSPECKEFSNAKVKGEEGPEQLSQAEAVCNFLRVLQPKYFVLENVQGYYNSRSYRNIVNTLDSLGYWTSAEVLNSADLGVPQTRRRLILRAVKDELVPVLPLPVRWVGWYEAIEDLIPSLPESRFAKWQLERLPEDFLGQFLMRSQNTQQEGGNQVRPVDWPAMTIGQNEKPKAFLMPVNGENSEYFEAHNPAPSIVSGHGAGKYRAFLIPGDNASNETIRMADEPMVTVRTRPISQCPARAWLSQGKVVQMTPRALARFQAMPDSYILPDKDSLACKVIGNGIPGLMAAKIFDNLVGVEARNQAAA
jgi:DNA-cytosine methyltransferase